MKDEDEDAERRGLMVTNKENEEGKQREMTEMTMKETLLDRREERKEEVVVQEEKKEDEAPGRWMKMRMNRANKQAKQDLITRCEHKKHERKVRKSKQTTKRQQITNRRINRT